MRARRPRENYTTQASLDLSEGIIGMINEPAVVGRNRWFRIEPRIGRCEEINFGSSPASSVRRCVFCKGRLSRLGVTDRLFIKTSGGDAEVRRSRAGGGHGTNRSGFPPVIGVESGVTTAPYPSHLTRKINGQNIPSGTRGPECDPAAIRFARLVGDAWRDVTGAARADHSTSQRRKLYLDD
ncbi:hypothetical protein EVAR_52619_1 [Eumeta japonica]|uniref:Uncharacterized protein n=1 Tax=Eumeta variegata TaxID=151549 RepID=A0A4C1YP82_EUMVA|nr:hypothetical protein EVAR_52619_1 [Eumeta japonica]